MISPESGFSPEVRAARGSLSIRVAGGLAAALLAFVYLPTIRWLCERWTMSVWQHAHGAIVPPIVGYLCWSRLRGRWREPADREGLGLLLVVPALGLHALDAGLRTQILSAISLVLILPGLSLLLLGLRRTREIAFPLAATSFMLPLPLALLEPVHLALRSIAVECAARILPILGLTALREGHLLALPESSLLVADACSGFSTVYASVTLAFLLAYWTDSPWRRVAVLATAVPVAIGANAVRVVLLALAVHHYGTQITETWVHTGSGVLTFMLSLPVLIWIGRPISRR